MSAARIGYALIDTASGRVALAWKGSSILAIQTPEATDAGTVERLLAAAPGARPTQPPPAIERAIDRIRRSLAGERVDLSRIRLAMDALPPFRRAVYEAARRVKWGHVLSYGELAAAVGRPGAARAVGTAMASCPFPVVVPCQRIIGASGKPGGWSSRGGLDAKAGLLALEGRALRPEDRARVVEREKVKATTNLSKSSPAPPAPKAIKPVSTPPRPDPAAPPPYDRALAVAHLRAADPILARVIDRVGDCTLSIRPSGETFASLAEAIVYQQLHARAARTIFERLCAAVGGDVLTAAAVYAMPDEALRSAGLSTNKLRALRDLTAHDLAGELPSRADLLTLDDDTVIERLTRVRGVGRWTVEMLLLFRLGRPDVLPSTDYGVQQGFMRALGLPDAPKPAVITSHGERWRPFRSVASWYLWRLLDAT